MDDDNKTAVSSDIVGAAYMVYLESRSQDLYLTSLPYDVSFEGNSFIGVGSLGKIGEIKEGSDIQSYSLSMELTGIPSGMISEAMDADMQGLTCKVWLAVIASDMSIIGNPTLMFRGKTDTMEIKIGESATITLQAESRLVDWERPRTELYTDATQKKKWPDDKGLEFVDATSKVEIIWGQR
jgi:hypothetical protein